MAPLEVEKVGVSDYRVVSSPRVLAAVGLGSCVGVCLYDPLSKIGGLAHIMLPDSSIWNSKKFKPAKFADTAVGVTLDDMIEQGALKYRIGAKIAGGARMFFDNGNGTDENDIFNIGSRNVEAVKKALKSEGIKIVGEDTGGIYGRSVNFYTDSGLVVIKTKMGRREI